MIRYFAAAVLAATFSVVVIVAPAQAASARTQAQHFQIAAGDLGQALDDTAADRMRERPERIVNHRVNGSTLLTWGQVLVLS